MKKTFIDAEASRVLAVLGIWVLMVGWGALWYRSLYASGQLLSVTEASHDLPGILRQTLVVCLPQLLPLGTALLRWRRKTLDRLWLRVKSPLAILLSLSLGLLYLLCLPVQATRSGDPGTVLFRWLYYLLAVAGLEELIFRGLMPSLLEGKTSRVLTWLLPSVLFSLAHNMVPLAVGQETDILLRHAASAFLGHMVSGLFWEWLKRKADSLLPGLLLHALCDFGLFLGP